MFSWQIQFSKVLVEWEAGICTDECVFKSVSSKSLFSQTAVIFAAGTRDYPGAYNAKVNYRC